MGTVAVDLGLRGATTGGFNASRDGVHKESIDVSLAEEGGDGEVRYDGVIPDLAWNSSKQLTSPPNPNEADPIPAHSGVVHVAVRTLEVELEAEALAVEGIEA